MDLRNQIGATDRRFRRVRGKTPRFHDDPSVDRLFAITMALAGELSAVRARLDTHERLAEAGKVASRAEIEAFEADDTAKAERLAEMNRMLDAVFRTMTESEINDRRSDDSEAHERLLASFEAAE